jgi:ribonuclease HII
MIEKYPTYEVEDELKGFGYKYIVGIDEVGRGCEHPSSEILTRAGWKHYLNVSPDDSVLSYTSNGKIVWQKVDEVIEKDFDGVMIELRNKSIHILVTPDHYFDVLRRTFERNKLESNKLKMTGYTFRGRRSVLELSNNDFIPRGGCWVGEKPDHFVLPSVDKNKFDFSGKDYSEKKIKMSLWVAFLGIYLAEGSISYTKGRAYSIQISQKKGKSYERIYNLCKQLPFKVFRCKQGIVIRNKQLYQYLLQFGKCYTKHIPQDIKNLSKDLLDTLIYWMLLGDGSCYKGINRKRVCVYYTTSKKLKDDFEEILLKVGKSYKTTTREPRNSSIRGRKIKKESHVPCYETRIRQNTKCTVKYLHKSDVLYKGKVFCLCLAEHHNFYVRRGGAGYFTGNCLSGPVVASSVFIPDEHIGNFVGRVKDSKKLSDIKRRELYPELTKKCHYGIGIVGNITIDKINILEATKLAMQKAFENMKFNYINKYDYVLVDGNVNLDFMYIPYRQIINGDNISVSIAAASIIAKVTRDDIMEQMHYVYPVYNWLKNKGYGTKEHIEAINVYGSTEFHRYSFSKVRED